MSILIKGMGKPKRCLACPFMVSRDNDDCILQSDEANAKFNSWDDMKASCPLVEILTPHGRLADLDQMIEDYWDGSAMRIDNTDLKEIEEYDVVIEAEDGT